MHSRQHVLVRIAQLLEDRGGGLGGWGLSVHHVKQSQLVLDDVGNGLCVGGRAGSATPNGVGDTGQLVCHSVGDVCAGGGSGVGA